MDKIEESDEKILSEEESYSKNTKKLSRRSRLFSRIKRKFFLRYVWLTRAAIFFVGALVVVFLFSRIFSYLGGTKVGFWFSMGKNFLFTPAESVEQIDGNTNILILGKAGEGHTAPDLTDTMIFCSIDHETSEILLLSLPRDIWLENLKTKLNSVYYYGNKRKEGGGVVLAKSTVEQVVGVPVHYAVVIDFNGFVEMIDLVSGVEIDVAKTFTDEKYPIAGKENDECDGDLEYLCRYETITFKEGLQNMNGEAALKYVRSRQSEDLDEGTDQARSKRQRLVIDALMSKLLTREFITSPKMISEVFSLSEKYVETDIVPAALAVIARRGFDGREKIASESFPEELLENPPISPKYQNQYVFIPAASVEDWSQIHQFVKRLLP